MSAENVEIVRRSFEGFQARLAEGDPAANFDSADIAPDAEWVMPPGSPGFRDVYRGREGFAEFMRTWTTSSEMAKSCG
jgi:ketosteroid isomerase-like protein